MCRIPTQYGLQAVLTNHCWMSKRLSLKLNHIMTRYMYMHSTKLCSYNIHVIETKLAKFLWSFKKEWKHVTDYNWKDLFTSELTKGNLFYCFFLNENGTSSRFFERWQQLYFAVQDIIPSVTAQLILPFLCVCDSQSFTLLLQYWYMSQF